MAVHIRCRWKAQLEAQVLMLSANNIPSPANGTPLAGADPGHGPSASTT